MLLKDISKKMSSYSILLNSAKFDGFNKMIYRFPQTLEMKNKEVFLVNFSFYNCFFNISTALANNLITITFPVFTSGNQLLRGILTDYTHVLSDGFYSIKDINASLQNFFIEKKLYLHDATNQQNMYFAGFIQNSVGNAFQLNTYYVLWRTAPIVRTVA
jgi:hypothetical protein